MTDVPDRGDVATVKAQDKLGRLNAQVASMRAILTQLLQEVVRAESLLEHTQTTRLLEANERLVVSALGALTDAEIAYDARDELSRTGGLDQLTGLPNRTLLLDRLEHAISNSKRHGNRVALLFLDLNGFKQINDAFGHAAEDRALQLVADCLRSLVRETDTVCRHGGDEFLIVLAEVANAADAAIVAEKVNAALGEYSQVDGHEMRLTASIGISIYPEDGVDTKTLIDRADAAMYLAKKQEQGGFAFYTEQSLDQPSLPALAVRSQHQRLSHHEVELAEHERRHEQLREANGQLVLAALGAQELLAAAEEARRRQSSLLTLVANELSNPFAPIRLAAATLGRPDAERTLLPRARAIIEQQADKMARLVSELLDPRQVSNAVLSQESQTFDAAEPIGAAVEACRLAMNRRQQTLEVTISPPLEMYGDADLLTQTLKSLLTNASVYTHNGGWIRVGADVVDGKLLLTVVDSGRGVSQHTAEAIFDPFVLDSRASVVNEDGAGVRLAAVREIVEPHGGTVVATIAAGGHGSQFTVSLPTRSAPVNAGRLDLATEQCLPASDSIQA
jgi:diguanylate cyclase (GGDEF)-like protein